MKRFGGYWRFPDMLDFCYLVNPYYPSARMMDEMRANFNVLLTEYPSGMYVNSLLASKCFGVHQDYIVPGNGAAELIKSIMSMSSGKIGITYPTFEEYPNRRTPSDIVVFTPDNPDFRYTVNDLMRFFESEPIETLLLVNPDNPSGNFIPLDDICVLASWCAKKQIRLIVDESFVDFSENYQDNTLLRNDLLEAYPNMIVMKSISKSFGVPGLRLGIMASADKAVISSVKKDVAIWNLNSFAEFYMQIFTKYEIDYRKACEKFQVERKRLFAALRNISYLRVIPSQANYFLCEVLPPFTSHRLVEMMLKEHNILLKDCSSKKAFTNRNYIRVAIRDAKDNARLVESLTGYEQ